MAESRRGRPSLDQDSSNPSADVHLTLKAKDYDRIDQLAKQRRESIQEVIRHGLKHLLRDEKNI